MRKILSSLGFALRNAAQNFRRNLAISVAGVVTTGLILIMVGGVLLMTHSVDSVLNAEQSHVSKIKIYLKDSDSLASIIDFESMLQQSHEVLSVSFENKDQAAAEFASQSSAYQSDLAALGSTNNPLPASLNLQVKQLTDLQTIATMAKSNPLVDPATATDYNPTVINRLRQLIVVIRVVGFVLSIILGFISLVLIMNTIRTAVYVRRIEIEIMKLVGATDWFVRWPFIVEGMIGGLLAALVANSVLTGGYHLIIGAVRGSLLVYALNFDQGYLTYTWMLVGIVGMGIGALGSYLGVRRFLSV